MDFANPSQPQEVCNLGGSSPFEFLNAQQLVIYPNVADGSVPADGLVNQPFAVVDLPGLAYHWFSIPAGTETMNALFAVSPNGDQIVWDAARPDWLPFDRIHLSSATPGTDGQWNDSVIATLPDTFGRECGPSNKGNPAAYTTSGSAFFVYDAPMPEISLLVDRGGKIVYQSIGTAKADPASRPEHPLWSPVSETLYYTQSGNAWEWTPAGGVKLLLKGVTWSAATVSPDGSHLAYESLEGSVVHVYLVDLAHHGQPVRVGNGQRGAPAFLDNTELYYAATASGGCGGGGDGVFIYDLRSGTERPSPVDWVLKTWPATSTAGW